MSADSSFININLEEDTENPMEIELPSAEVDNEAETIPKQQEKEKIKDENMGNKKEQAQIQAQITSEPSPEKSAIEEYSINLENINLSLSKKFKVLRDLILDSAVAHNDIVDTVLSLLVQDNSGNLPANKSHAPFDIESNYVIESSQAILEMMAILDVCSEKVNAEILSIFIAICRKCDRTLLRCREVKLGEIILEKIPRSTGIIADLYLDLITILFQFSINLNEFRQLYNQLCINPMTGNLHRHSASLLKVLTSAVIRENGCPDAYFSFAGRGKSSIVLPPIRSLPNSSSWSFQCWFRYESSIFQTEQPIPTSDAPAIPESQEELIKPYLYCFRTSSGIGYSAHFVSSCLVITSLKTPGKGFQHAIKYEFKPQQWYHLSINFIYNRWKTSEIETFVNGQLVSSGDLAWEVTPQSNEKFDKCFIGSADTGDESRLFCGQIASLYLFNKSLNPDQVSAIYHLGPSYRNQFQFSSESDNILTSKQKDHLYNTDLSESILLSYNPKSTDNNLCLECSPRNRYVHGSSAPNSVPQELMKIVDLPHALMMSDVEAVFTDSVEHALHSCGGIEVLFPLFSQLDVEFDRNDIFNNEVHGYDRLRGDGSSMVDPTTGERICAMNNKPNIAAMLLRLIERILKSSINSQQQMLQSKGFLLIAKYIQNSASKHVDELFLKVVLDIIQMLESQPYGILLTRHICDYILFNSDLWIYSSVNVQLKMYKFFKNEFIKHNVLKSSNRRISTVLLLMHSLKYYYWVDNPTTCSGFEAKGLDNDKLFKKRPNKEEIKSIRVYILLLIKGLMCIPLNGDDSNLRNNRRIPTGDELQSILNYLLVIQEPENLNDVLQLLLSLTAEKPSEMVPLLDDHNIIELRLGFES